MSSQIPSPFHQKQGTNPQLLPCRCIVRKSDAGPSLSNGSCERTDGSVAPNVTDFEEVAALLKTAAATGVHMTVLKIVQLLLQRN